MMLRRAALKSFVGIVVLALAACVYASGQTKAGPVDPGVRGGPAGAGDPLKGLTPDEAAIEAAMPKAHTVFTELARLLGEQRYFTGDAVSLADLLIAPQLAFFTQTPEWSVLSAPHANMIRMVLV